MLWKRVSFKKKFHLSSKCRWIQNHAGEELTSHLGCFSKTQKLTLVSSVFSHGNTLPLPKKKHNLLDIQTPWGLVFEVCWKGSPVIPNLKRWLSLDVGWDRKFGWPTLKKSVAISGKKEGFDLCLTRRVPLGSFGSPVTPEIFGLLRVDFW